jgi:hypothetical protein
MEPAQSTVDPVLSASGLVTVQRERQAQMHFNNDMMQCRWIANIKPLFLGNTIRDELGVVDAHILRAQSQVSRFLRLKRVLSGIWIRKNKVERTVLHKIQVKCPAIRAENVIEIACTIIDMEMKAERLQARQHLPERNERATGPLTLCRVLPPNTFLSTL